jgi:hypothetical protein
MVKAGSHAPLTSKIAIPFFGRKAVKNVGFVFSGDDFGDVVVFVKKCVVCHYQLIVPVPAVNV